MESWKDIPGFVNYEVSDQGRVANKRTNRILKGGVIPAGYVQVTLRRDIKNFNSYVHILVAEAFLGPRPDPTWEVNHKHSPKLDNRAVNLEWVTASENIQHAFRTGLHRTRQVRIVETNEVFFNATALAKFLNVSDSTISNHLAGRYPHVKGYHLERLD